MKLIRVVCLVALVFGAGCSLVVVSNLKAEGLAANGLAEPVLLFGIGMHIEPLGRTAQGYGGGGADYRQGPLFERHVQDILAVAKIVEGHGGRMTVQAQSPFTQVALSKGNTILRDLETRGHEIALHFHEDAHLGRDPERLPVQTWCAVMQEEISYIQQAGAQKKIRYWSGGNLYTGVLEAASCAGLDVMSDWKNYKTQRTDLSLVGVHPWRPAGGPSETDLSKFATHDPNGKVIFLPEGNYSREDFASSRRAAGGDAAYFEYLKTELLRSLEVARADKVNVFHFTIHPGEFRGDPARPFGVIEDFLTNVVDPLVKAGKIRWATFSQMADEFIAWEKANPGVDPRSASLSAQPPLPTERDVTYCTLDGVELKMDIYRPQGSAAPTPALLYVHGGGWTGGDKRSGKGIRDIPELLARGYLVAAVNYRLAPRYKFPAMIEDVKCAVRFLRANAERFSINPEKIGAWGGSAGGHLVALLGTSDATAGWDVGQYLEQSSRVQAVVDMYGPTDLTVLFEGANPRLMEQVFGTSDRNSETLQKASPVNWVSLDDPPFLILHGERDPLVPVSQSQLLYEKLQAACVPATFVIVKNAGHGFAPLGGPISPSRQELTKMIADFFDQYLK
jgi:acetyl esterase/lipase